MTPMSVTARTRPSLISPHGQRDIRVVASLRILVGVGTAMVLIAAGHLNGHVISYGPGALDPRLFALAAGGIILTAAASFTELYWGATSAVDEERRLRRRFLTHIFTTARTPDARDDAKRDEGYVALLTDAPERIGHYRLGYWGSTLAALATPFLTVVYMGVAIDWVIALIMLVMCAVVPVSIGVFLAFFRRTSARSRSQRTQLAARYLDAIRNLVTIRLFGAGQRIEDDLRERGEHNRRAIMRLLAGNQIVIIVLDGVFSLCLICALVALSMWRFTGGHIGIDDAITATLLGLLLIEPLAQVSGFFYIGMGGKASERAARRVLATPVRRSRNTEAAAGSRREVGDTTAVVVSLTDVRHDYGRGEVLHGITANIERGQRIGIVGRSGGGKTTLISLIDGSLTPTAGAVSVSEQAAVVRQRTWLFTGTVADNLRVANTDATDEQMWHALDAAHLGDDVRAMSGGLHTHLGENGRLMSAGQAQRLSLARALLSGRRLIILDEPTSQVDRESERQMMAAIGGIGREVTLVLVTHRADILDLVDEVWRVEDGTIASRHAPQSRAGEEHALSAESAPRTESTAHAEPELQPQGETNTEPAVKPATGSDTVTEPTTSELVRWLMSITQPVHRPLLASTAMRVIQMLLDVALFATAGAAITATGMWLVKGGAPVNIPLVLTVLVVIAVAKAVGRYLEQFLGHFVAFKALELLRTHVFSTLWPKAPAILNRSRSGDLLASLTRDVDRIEVFYAHTFAPIVSAFVVPVVTLVAMAGVANVKVTLIPGLCLLLALTVVPGWGWRRALTATARTLGVRRAIAHHVTDSVYGREDVVGYGYADRRIAELDRLGEDVTRYARTPARINATRRALAAALMLVASVNVIITGVNSGVPIVVIAGICAGMLRLFEAPRGIEDAVGYLDHSLASARRLYDISHEPMRVSDGVEDTLAPTAASVTWEHVSYRYPQRDSAASEAMPLALDDVTIEVPAGDHAVIVGASGSGKTTLIQMLLRFDDPDRGRVLISGIPVTRYTLDALRHRVALVSQRSELLAATVADNLRLANPDATDAMMWRVLDIAQLGNDIRAMPDGLDTRVGTAGTALSGGQAQRLCLARALLTEPAVLILDEFTAHVDDALDQDMRRHLLDALNDTTIIEITHRRSVADTAAHLIRIDRGRVVEERRPATN